MRDNTFSRKDAVIARKRIAGLLEEMKHQSVSPLVLFMLGSVERGTRVFRHQSWESLQLYNELQDIDLEQFLPIAGFYSFGTFVSIGSEDETRSEYEKKMVALLETDSVYALLTDGRDFSRCIDFFSFIAINLKSD